MSSIRLLTGLVLAAILAVYTIVLLIAVAALAIVCRHNRTRAPQRAAAALRHLRGASAALAVTILADLAFLYADSLIGATVLRIFAELERPRLWVEGDAVLLGWGIVVAAAWLVVARRRRGPVA